jgi:Protein of unknown function (DUF2934)
VSGKVCAGCGCRRPRGRLKVAGPLSARQNRRAMPAKGAVRAYEAWENQGRPNGCDLINSRHSNQQIISSVLEGWCSSLAARPMGCRQKRQSEPPNEAADWGLPCRQLFKIESSLRRSSLTTRSFAFLPSRAGRSCLRDGLRTRCGWPTRRPRPWLRTLWPFPMDPIMPRRFCGISRDSCPRAAPRYPKQTWPLLWPTACSRRCGNSPKRL